MREVRYVLVDDVDGSQAKETLRFAVGKQFYEIDLSEENAEQFNRDLEKWVKHARKVAGVPGRRTRNGGSGSKSSDAATIRLWASERGIEVPSRGRIPSEIRRRYESANS